MPREDVSIQNFSGGELGPNLYGRNDLQVYRNGARRIENFIVESTGSAKFRPGFEYIHHTRLNRTALLLDFEFNTLQAYALEFTDKKLRFYRNRAIITEDPLSITGSITNANPAVVNLTSHGFSNGDEVLIEDTEGISDINSKFFIVAGVTANTFQLNDIDGNAIDSSSFGTHISATGVVKKIYEIDSPYSEANDLFQIVVDQDANTMYITHPFYEPRKLTRTSHITWTLERYARTADPFTDKKTPTAITQANPGVVTSTAHGYSNGDRVYAEAIVGMTEVNSEVYQVANVTANTFELNDLDGNPVDTTGFTAFVSGGYFSDQSLLSSCLAFYESRLWFSGLESQPGQFIGSRSPVDSSGGVARYDDFTVSGSPLATDAVFFTLAAGNNAILWMSGTDKSLIIGTVGSLHRVKAGTAEGNISPTSISAREFDSVGVQDVPPVSSRNKSIVYVQKAGLAVISIDFDFLSDSFKPTDRNLLSSLITKGCLTQLSWRVGRPDVMWAICGSGELLGLTYQADEGVYGWHRHNTGASKEDKFTSVTTVTRPNAFNETWVVVERVIDGKTRRYVEASSDWVDLPVKEEFFTNIDEKTENIAKFQRALYEKQKEYNYLDSSLKYDGSALNLSAGAAITPGATTGTGVVFTATAGVFASTDIGREIRKKSMDGEGFGRAEITAYTGPGTVTCTVLEDFDNANQIAAGDWYLTAGSISNLDHLEGRVVSIIADGAVHADKTVSDGSITLDYQATVVYVGLKYVGFLQSMPLEYGAVTGSSVGKIKNITEVAIRFHETLGAEFGTDLYKPAILKFSTTPLMVGSPAEAFTGIKSITYNDRWEGEKIVYVRQTNPAPCSVQLISTTGEVDSE